MCNALFYSLKALHPELRDELAIITKDTKINVGGKIRIVTDGVLLRMLADNSISDSSIYFDESHQMSSQLELCMSEMVVNGRFFARTLAINYRRILFDILVMNPSRKHRHRRRR